MSSVLTGPTWVDWGTPAAKAGTMGVWLQVRCLRCSRRGQVGPNTLGRGGADPLYRVVDRLQCLDCKAVGLVHVTIFKAER